jgi:hypothetical protein
MDNVENLRKLKSLFDDGILSEKEFSEMKLKLLNNETFKKDNEFSSGILSISFAGHWFIVDASTELFINDELHSTHSTKSGFSVSIPIQSDKIILKLVLGGMRTTTYEIEELDATKNYSMELIYSDMWGRYSNKFKFNENG